MDTVLLVAHSLNRWLVLALLLAAIILGFKGWLSKGEWKPLNKKIHIGVIATVHTQLLLGFILYMGGSPLMKTVFADMSVTMKDATLRFWAVEHIMMMCIAGVVVHVSHVISKRAEEDAKKFKVAAIGFTFGLLIMFAAIPWPFRAGIGRALFPSL